MPVTSDPRLRMPGSQPGDASLEGSDRCGNCHEDPTKELTIESDMRGSMMSHSLRDPLFWATLTVAAQDSIWALGNPNATDLCLRCHTPPGWIEGRSDPTNGSTLRDGDFDGVSCDSCHRLVDPFFEATYAGFRDSGDWDEATSLSSNERDRTRAANSLEVSALTYFDATPYYGNDDRPLESGWTENASGQFVLAASNDKRASFADSVARHNWLYSRYHKARHFCGNCHDVSNAVLHNLSWRGSGPLPAEQDPAYSYFHVERTFSEFMLSDFGVGEGAEGSGYFAPSTFKTSQPGNLISTCQDCHMADEVGVGCDKADAVTRPTGSQEHPASGQPKHDLTGGNAWVPALLASSITGASNYDSTNDALLNQGSSVLTMDLAAGQGLDADALLRGARRAETNLRRAASLQSVVYDPASGSLSLRVRNHTGHKLISGYPEGRRMWLNIRVWSGSTLAEEINPFDDAVGTLRGLDPTHAPSSPPLAANERHEDALVYEMIASSTLTGEAKTFHFVLADGRYKDNRIPPKGFRIAQAAQRLVTPVMGGVEDPDLFSAAEYAGGYDDVHLTVAEGGDAVDVTLYYQTTTREYVEFLRDEINGTASTLSAPAPSGESEAYIVQSDPFFDRLAAWGDTIFALWDHNRGVPGAAPVTMSTAQATVLLGGCAAPNSDGVPCDDGDPCTTDDVCAAGSCNGTPLICDNPGLCEGAGSCNSATGACEYSSLTGTRCDDGDACTTGDQCDDGRCTPGTALVCDAPPECHTGGRCSSGACLYTPVADGSACAGGTCLAGSCQALPTDGGVDAGSDAGMDSGVDAAVDSGLDATSDGATDAGVDGGSDAAGHTASDAGTDATAATDAGTNGASDSRPDAARGGGILADGGMDSAVDGGGTAGGCQLGGARRTMPVHGTYWLLLVSVAGLALRRCRRRG